MHEIVIEERVSVSLFNLMYSYVMAHGATPENFIFSGMAPVIGIMEPPIILTEI